MLRNCSAIIIAVLKVLPRVSAIAALFLAFSIVSRSMANDPLETVEAFFSPGGIEDKAAVYTGEMLRFVNERTMGQYLGASAQREYRVLSRSDSAARYAISVTSHGVTQDWYAFLKKPSARWQLEAIRTLAQTGLLRTGVKGLRDKAQRTPEENWKLRNWELTLSSDAGLKAFLKPHLSGFEALLALVRSGSREAAAAAAKKLFLTSAASDRTGCIRMTIGGILDNTAGYIYVPPGVTPPFVTPEDVIYLEEVVDRWYVIKTT